MLASLLNIPHTNEEWAQFSWHHRISHDRIRQAIKAKYGYSLTDYSIDPMAPEAMAQFLQNNAQLHGDMNATLQLPGIDLLDVNLSKDNEKVAWVNFHYLEHYYAETKLGTGS